MSSIPNPGSAEAGREGCSCSPLFNNKGLKVPPEGWKIRAACPVHAPVIPPEATGDIVAVPAKALKTGWFRRMWRSLKTGGVSSLVDEMESPAPVAKEEELPTMDAGPLFGAIPTYEEAPWRSDETDG